MLTSVFQFVPYYYHFVGHWGAFFGLSWRILARWNKPMKSENEIILRCKHPINREAIFVLPLSYCVGERNIALIVLLPLFSAFIFSMPSKVIMIVKKFMFLNIFWALLRARFNTCFTARAKMSLSRAQGPVFRKSRELFGPEKPFVNLRPAYFY